MQIAVTQLKAQLTASRAQVTIVEKDREEVSIELVVFNHRSQKRVPAIISRALSK